MTTLLEIRILPRDAEPRRGEQRSVWRLQCATAVVACMEAQVRDHAHPKDWPDRGEQIGNTVCIPYKRRRRGSGCVKYSRTVVICSSGSDRGANPWCMGFIAPRRDHASRLEIVSCTGNAQRPLDAVDCGERPRSARSLEAAIAQ